MGRGDKRTKRGKISLGTFGVSRPAKNETKAVEKKEVATAKKPAKAE